MNIREVYGSGFCTGCGTCTGICPNNAIEMVIDKKKGVYRPVINEGRCIDCGICYNVCIGHSVDFNELNDFVFGKIPENILLGNHMDCYEGYSSDYNIRYNSASGGLVTQLLIFALEERMIDGALVTRMNNDKPLEPEPFIARTKEEIISASKSKYCPVPANSVIKEIINANDGEKFAIVGLPCHIQGIRKAEMVNKRLKEKIVLHLGIICGHAPNFLATKCLLHTIGIKENDVRKIDYRGNGWPGGMSIGLKNSICRVIPYRHQYAMRGLLSSILFTPLPCILCGDGSCEFSDISFGDAWLSEFTKDKIGRSVIIIRTPKGNEFIRSAISKKKINVTKITINKAIESQKRMFYSKKRNLKSRIFIFKLLFTRDIPYMNLKLMEPNQIYYLFAIPLLVIAYFLLKIDASTFLKHMPFLFVKCSKGLGILK